MIENGIELAEVAVVDCRVHGEGDLMREEIPGLVLPGWACASCGAFNGEARERRASCRACDACRCGLGRIAAGEPCEVCSPPGVTS